MQEEVMKVVQEGTLESIYVDDLINAQVSYKHVFV